MALMQNAISGVDLAIYPYELEEHWPGTSPLFYTSVMVRYKGRLVLDETVSLSSSFFATMSREFRDVLDGIKQSAWIRNRDDNLLIAVARKLPRKYRIEPGHVYFTLAWGVPLTLVESFGFSVSAGTLAEFLSNILDEGSKAYPDSRDIHNFSDSA